MNGRIVTIVLAVLVSVLVNGALLFDESQGKICPPDEQTKAEARSQDKLFGMQFTPASREKNIKEMGFSPDDAKAILTALSALEERYQTKNPELDRVTALLEASDDDGLEAGFCGSGTTLPVRYGAMAYLVKERDGILTPLDLDVISEFQLQDWAKGWRTPAVYGDAELTKERKDDAPRMVLAAILARDETTLLEHKSPWGRAVLVGGWSWDGVAKKHPGIHDRVRQYVAVMHLVLEVASRDGSLCAT